MDHRCALYKQSYCKHLRYFILPILNLTKSILIICVTSQVPDVDAPNYFDGLSDANADDEVAEDVAYYHHNAEENVGIDHWMMTWKKMLDDYNVCGTVVDIDHCSQCCDYCGIVIYGGPEYGDDNVDAGNLDVVDVRMVFVALAQGKSCRNGYLKYGYWMVDLLQSQNLLTFSDL